LAHRSSAASWKSSSRFLLSAVDMKVRSKVLLA
jgi:hypothetical protein